MSRWDNIEPALTWGRPVLLQTPYGSGTQEEFVALAVMIYRLLVEMHINRHPHFINVKRFREMH